MNISVVLSTYNGAKYIIDQMESLKSQSRAADEVLIFDDCSTDGTVDKVEAFIERNKLYNWRLNKNKDNLGFRKNFMQGIAKCNGELVFLCDQDDVWMPDKIKLMAEAVENNDNIDVLACSYTSWYTDGTKKVTSLIGGGGGRTLKRLFTQIISYRCHRDALMD